jgi:hypothetical protein
MASKIKAINAYCPRIELGDAADPNRFMELITNRTTLSSGVVKNVQESEVETLIGLLKEGRPVHTGIAIFTPSIELDGDINIHVRVDKRILAALNQEGIFSGNILNASHIGLSSDDLVEMWNQEHPEDLVE